MKYIIILGDGMADYPLPSLQGKTPLMAADIPVIDSLCRQGRCGLFKTVPDHLPPGSEVANLAVLGYDVDKVYQGRGVLEAASIGVTVNPGDLAMRCNLICLEGDKIKNHSAGHISTAEAAQLIEVLNKELSTAQFHFYPGVSYRHIAIYAKGSNQIRCTPPHDVPGTPFREVLIKAKNSDGRQTAEVLNQLIFASQKILIKHPVNIARQNAGKDPANSIWFWSAGYKPEMKMLKQLYGINGAVISAVDLLHGIGVYAGMEVIKVPGATGLIDTNYEGKAQAAINALKTNDLVYVHVEATDEAGHEGNAALKIKALEYLDSRLVKPIFEQTQQMQEPVTIAVLPDHATPCALRTHTRDAVPFLIYNPHLPADSVQLYNEESVKAGHYGTLTSNQFIKALLN
jgi:2,3-bisphosphoglycerate-independent phosphoglycerate mutase